MKCDDAIDSPQRRLQRQRKRFKKSGLWKKHLMRRVVGKIRSKYNISTTIELRHHFDIYLSSSSPESESRSSDDSDDSTEEGYATFTSFLEQLRSQYRNSSTYDIDEEDNEENRDAASNGFSLFSLQTDGDLPMKTTNDHSRNFNSFDSSRLELSDSDSIWGSYSDLLSMLSPQSNTNNFNHSCSLGIPATGGN